jgi:hypothetical protein
MKRLRNHAILVGASIIPLTMMVRPSLAQEPVSLCVVLGGQLRVIPAVRVGRDTLVQGRRFQEAYPATAPNYAATEIWLRNRQMLTFRATVYHPIGGAVTIPARELRRIGFFDQIPLFRRADDPTSIFVPVAPGCRFQRYYAPQIVPPPPPPPPVAHSLRLCVVQGTEIIEVEALYRSTTGDTIVRRRGESMLFSTAYPTDGRFLVNHTFWRERRAIRFRDARYVIYQGERVLQHGDVESIGVFRGVPVFAEPGQQVRPEAIYLPVRVGCVFQAYVLSP